MKTLHLNLKKKWFDMIQSGEKKEEYRDISNYWAWRFINVLGELESASWVEFIEDLADPNRRHLDWKECLDFFDVEFVEFEKVHFKNGWARPDGTPAPQFEIELTGFRIGPGKPEWGAEPGKEYFILELGEILP